MRSPLRRAGPGARPDRRDRCGVGVGWCSFRPAHRPEHLIDVGIRESDPVEERGELFLEALRPIGRRWAAGRLPGSRVADAPPVVVRVAVVGAPALDAAHQAGERIGQFVERVKPPE